MSEKSYVDGTEKRFHEAWLGMVQPVEGLVVSIPVLVEAQCMERQSPEVQAKLLTLCPPTRKEDDLPAGFAITDLERFFEQLLGYSPERFDRAGTLPETLSLWVPEGKQSIAPTFALKKEGEPGHEMLVWDLPLGLDLDAPETTTGPWEYPPSAKFNRLLRHGRVPIGLLTNREVVRLVYAPHGESSGAITFRIADLASVGGRPILDAMVMLLSASRFFGVAKERALPAILAESRKRQANVTNDLAEQVFDALQILLRGFEAAASRDGRALLDEALQREGDHVYKGLLTVLLRLVFVLYAEDRALLPVDHPIYAGSLSVVALFEDLQRDRGAYPDSMSRRFGAWGRLVALFRCVFLGVSHGTLTMPARRGSLFDPHLYPFLEGWGPAGGAPIVDGEARAAVRLPTVDDDTIHRVLEKLLVFEGQRLSYRALDVEQIGSVYEALMGFHVVPVPEAAVCLRPDRVWLTASEVLAQPANRCAKWLKETTGLSTAHADKLAKEVAVASGADAVLEALGKFAAGGRHADPSLTRARPLQLVLQPGSERRRTSSHYTPRTLSAPIVRRTLEPLLTVMGESPASERILNLKVCDPAMGSGAFLVEACRFLADHVHEAWGREGKLDGVTTQHGDALMHARRLVAQRCLYGVDKNEAAVELAKLSLWLVTLAKNLPFTFVDHALRHGDSLVGLDFEQIRSFHWKPGTQLEFARKVLDDALAEGIELRQKILALAESDAVDDQREKERLLWDARDALDRVRLVGDVIVGAFFAHEKDKDREKERVRRLDLVKAWLDAGGPPPDNLRAMQDEVRDRTPVFHWMLEYPEVFYAERPDPLEDGAVNRAAYMDAFVGNPPFAGKNVLSRTSGPIYGAWLTSTVQDSDGNADLVAFFFRAAHALLGRHGTLGFIATKVIADGLTRATGLVPMAKSGAQVFYADSNLEWPGEAGVTIAVVCVAVGRAIEGVAERRLDGRVVAQITTELAEGAERPDPHRLASNNGLMAQGLIPHGSGFYLQREEHQRFIDADPRNGERMFPALGGDEFLSHPRQQTDRFAIHFGTAEFAEASEYPDLLRHLERTVREERDALPDSDINRRLKRLWWRFWTDRPALTEALRGTRRCIVGMVRLTENAWALVDAKQVFLTTVVVIPLESLSLFALLQSHVHSTWIESRATSRRQMITYSGPGCFETFPFPHPDPRTVILALESIGERLYETRTKYMVDENVGLTIMYNRLKDPSVTEARVVALRLLHREMDRAVLDAYGWTDVAVPPYCPTSDDERRQVERFEAEVIDRLFALNATRAEEEKLRGLSAGSKQKGSKRGGKKTGKDAPAEQASLGLEDDD